MEAARTAAARSAPTRAPRITPTVRRALRRARRVEHRALRDDDDALLGDREATAVGLRIVADGRAGGDDHALVDDGAPDLRVAADLDVVEQDRLAHVGEAVDAHARAEDR